MELNKFLALFFLLSMLVFADYEQEVLDDSPVAWWRFSEYRYKDGLSACDSMRNVQCAVYQGDTMTVTAGIDNKAGWFNGNSARVDLGNCLGGLLDGASAVTVEIWFRNSCIDPGLAKHGIFATRISGGYAGFEFGIEYNSSSPRITFGARSVCPDDSYKWIGADFSTVDQWTHLVCVADYANDRMKIYVNGSCVKNSSINFFSPYYVYGSPTQTDQIGCTPTLDNHFRGWIDEVAVYDSALSDTRILAHYNNGNPQEPAILWDSQIESKTSAGPFVASPCIHRFDNGILITSFDYWGPNNTKPETSIIKISYNNGLTWQSRSEVHPCQNATLFEHNGELYLFGITEQYGHIRISKSTTYGLTWTDPIDSNTGLLFLAEQSGTLGYDTGPVPVLVANGRIYRIFERCIAEQAWPTDLAPVVVSADVNADLLKASSWTMTNAVSFDPDWADPAWDCSVPGWLEGNAVLAPNGEVWAIMRVHTNPSVDVAAILKLSQDNTTLSFDPDTGFIKMPGGMHKFYILRDPVTNKYLSFVNNNTDPTRAWQRNTLSLTSSEDLINWSHIRTVIQDNSPMTWHNSMYNTGFQYVVWQFDGEDIIFVSRTAYDGAASFHDSNRSTFHRLENYLSFVEPCGQWGYSAMDFNMDCVVDTFDLNEFAEDWLDLTDMVDFAFFAEEWKVCTHPYKSGCEHR